MAKDILSQENFDKLNEIILEHKTTPGALMPILHEAQGVVRSITT